MKLLKIPVPDGLFIHIPKTGGKSIRNSGIIDRNSKFYCYCRTPHKNCLETKEYMRNKHWNSIFKFCFVRNPYDRVVSAYHYVTMKHYCNKLLSNSLREAKHILEKHTFKEFCLMFKEDKVLKTKIMQEKLWIPQYKYITDNNGQIMVNYIGRFENFQQDWDYLCDNVFYHKYILPHKNNSIRRKDYMSYYDEETKQVISEYYKKDFEMFGYDKLLT